MVQNCCPCTFRNSMLLQNKKNCRRTVLFGKPHSRTEMVTTVAERTILTVLMEILLRNGGGGGRIPPMSAMSMGATEWDRSRFQRRPMALCDREGLSGSTHGSRSVCLRGTRAIVALLGFGGPDNPEDGLPLGVKEGSPPAFRPSPEVRTGLIFSVTRVV